MPPFRSSALGAPACPAREYWAAGANRGAGDVVWRQAFKAEVGTRRGQVSATIFWDLRKYYEHIDLRFLWEKCKQHNFPLCIARLAIQAYSCARFLTLGGVVDGPHWVCRGIVAGCTFATSLIRVFAMDLSTPYPKPSATWVYSTCI